MDFLFEILFDVITDLMLNGLPSHEPINSPAPAIPKTEREKLYLVFKIIITALSVLLLSGVIAIIAVPSPTIQTVAKYAIIISISLLCLLVLSTIVLITIATIRRKKQK